MKYRSDTANDDPGMAATASQLGQPLNHVGKGPSVHRFGSLLKEGCELLNINLETDGGRGLFTSGLRPQTLQMQKLLTVSPQPALKSPQRCSAALPL